MAIHQLLKNSGTAWKLQTGWDIGNAWGTHSYGETTMGRWWRLDYKRTREARPGKHRGPYLRGAAGREALIGDRRGGRLVGWGASITAVLLEWRLQNNTELKTMAPMEGRKIIDFSRTLREITLFSNSWLRRGLGWPSSCAVVQAKPLKYLLTGGCGMAWVRYCDRGGKSSGLESCSKLRLTPGMELRASENSRYLLQLYIDYISSVLSRLENTASKIYLFLVIKNPGFEQIHLNGI